jgi:hypothetical protein
MGGKGTFGPGTVCKATGMGELDGEWSVRRLGGLLPPLYGMRKQIDGTEGATVLGPAKARFDVVGRELRYRGVWSGLVDTVEPEGTGWQGVARYRGRVLGRFAMSPVISTRG